MKTLRRLEDAHGQALLDWLKTRDASCCIERDDGYVEGFDVGHYFRDYRHWSPEEKAGLRLVRGRVLDVGCGAARHALYLRKRGFAVLGIDQSPATIAVCRRRGFRNVRLLDMADLSSRLGRFDTIIMMGNNFALVGTPARAQRTLRRFLDFTTDRARVIAHMLDPYRTDKPAHLAYHARNRRQGRMPGQLKIRVRYQQFATPWFGMLLVSPAELRRLLVGTGWHLARLIDRGRPSFVAVLERTGSRLP
jgi:SAM-dependent methyltransferase